MNPYSYDECRQLDKGFKFSLPRFGFIDGVKIMTRLFLFSFVVICLVLFSVRMLFEGARFSRWTQNFFCKNRCPDTAVFFLDVFYIIAEDFCRGSPYLYFHLFQAYFSVF